MTASGFGAVDKVSKTGDSMTGPLTMATAPAGCIAESGSRLNVTSVAGGGSVSGRAQAVAIALPNNTAVHSMTFCTGTTAAGTVTHGWYALLDNTFKVLGTTADQGAGTWNVANALTTINLTSTFTTTYSGLYYAAWAVVATTPPSMASLSSNISTALAGASPLLCGISSTGLTTPPTVGSTLTITANAFWALYCYVS